MLADDVLMVHYEHQLVYREYAVFAGLVAICLVLFCFSSPSGGLCLLYTPVLNFSHIRNTAAP
jgi:hypothetical protein